MLKKLFPKQPNFFTSLSKIADLAFKSARELEALTQDKPNIEKTAAAISELENEADKTVHESLKTLTDTFITPIEREHLHSLFIMADEVVDMIHAVTQRCLAYRLNTLTAGTREMITLTVACVKQFQELIHRLDEIKSPEQLHRVSVEINRLENEIDHKMRTSLAALYESNLGVGNILKERDVILVIEEISDSVEKVTHIIEAVLLDQA